MSHSSIRRQKKRQPKKAEKHVEPDMRVAEFVTASLKRVHMRVKKY